MSKKFSKNKKHRVYVSMMTCAFKRRTPGDDESVPFLLKKDLYKDKVVSPSTH